HQEVLRAQARGRQRHHRCLDCAADHAGAAGSAAARAPSAADPGNRAGHAGLRSLGRPGAPGSLGGRALMLLRVERRMGLKIPWGLVAVPLAIALLGIWNLASASRPPHTPLWARQLLNLGVGVLAGVGVCLMDYRFIQRMAWPIYGLNAAALLALKVIGHRATDQAGWHQLGPLRIEPAEFMKVALIIALARFFHDDYREGEQPYGPVPLWKPLLLPLFAAGLVLPDLGNTMMILLTACTILVFSRLRLWVLGVGVAGLLAVSLVIWNDYVRDPADGHRTFVRQILK